MNGVVHVRDRDELDLVAGQGAADLVRGIGVGFLTPLDRNSSRTFCLAPLGRRKEREGGEGEVEGQGKVSRASSPRLAATHAFSKEAVEAALQKADGGRRNRCGSRQREPDAPAEDRAELGEPLLVQLRVVKLPRLLDELSLGLDGLPELVDGLLAAFGHYG